jgi:hypothetical protein
MLVAVALAAVAALLFIGAWLVSMVRAEDALGEDE